MQTDKPPGVHHGRRDLLDSDARSVGREDRVLGNLGLHFSKQGLLGLELLDDRLDNNIGLTDLRGIKINCQTFLGRGRIAGCS